MGRKLFHWLISIWAPLLFKSTKRSVSIQKWQYAIVSYKNIKFVNIGLLSMWMDFYKEDISISKPSKYTIYI
jgi:hypothetical protein